jgi:threonine dehydrogenase-like Zn-dependent dehydrogenase
MEVLLFGDGKLGQLVARALASTGCRLTVVGRHARKLALLADLPLRRVLDGDFGDGRYDVVVEATGRPSVLDRAVMNTKPRGTLVLKSTYAEEAPVNLSPIVVNEITVVGSRCGRFEAALAFIQRYRPPLEALIHKTFPLTEAPAALEEAGRSGVMKVLLKP